jgi:hypothetical protein
MAYIRPAGVQNSNFSLGEVSAFVNLNQGPSANDQVQANMEVLYQNIDTNNIPGCAPLPSTTSNLTIQWFYGRDDMGNTNYSPYYLSNTENGDNVDNTTYSIRNGWGELNVGTNRDFMAHLLAIDTTTGIRYYAGPQNSWGWRPGCTIYKVDGTCVTPISRYTNNNILGSIPQRGVTGAPFSPIINVTSGYGINAFSEDGNNARMVFLLYSWNVNTPSITYQTYTNSSNIPDMAASEEGAEDALWLGDGGATGFDTVAVLVQRQWWGRRICFAKRNNGGTFNSFKVQAMFNQYEENQTQGDNNGGCLAWDPINNVIYAVYVYRIAPGPWNSGLIYSKCNVNLNGTGQVQTSGMTTYRRYNAGAIPGARSLGTAIIHNDGVYNYLATSWNRTTNGLWDIYLEIYRNNPSTNTYTKMGNTENLLIQGGLFNDGAERIRIEKFADTEIVDSNGSPVNTYKNFVVSYVDSSNNTILRWFRFDQNNVGTGNNALTLMDTVTLASNYRGILGRNFSEITNQWLNSTLVMCSTANGSGNTYPWNSKAYNYQGLADVSVMLRLV